MHTALGRSGSFVKIINFFKIIKLFRCYLNQAQPNPVLPTEAPPDDLEAASASKAASDPEYSRPQWPTIFKVPQVIRDKEEAAFEPQIVSIGPYHRDKPRLKPMDKTKRRYLDKFLTRDPTKSLQYYHQRIHGLIERARACYYWEDASTLSDDEFVEILVLDGCFILELLLLRTKDRWHREDRSKQWEKQAEFDPILDVDWTFNPIYFDLLNLENQVPFFVLASLYDGIGVLSQLEVLVFKFMSVGFHFAQLRRHDDVYHLLHFWRTCIINKYEPRELKFKHIPTAQELVETGVMFKKKEGGNLLEVAFTEGILEMTPLSIDEYTSTLFHNVIAFEQCCPEVGGYVTSYCVLLDCLINTRADVRLLRQAKVVMSDIGSDDEVAALVNRLCKHVNVDHLPLATLLIDINEHCNHRWPRWRANLVHNYFSNPWAIISVVGAVMLLLLTFGQMFVAVFSYIRPPHN